MHSHLINLIAMTIDQAQEKVDNWIKTYGVKYYAPLTNLGILTEEVGELARVMVRTYGEQSEKPQDKQSRLGDEMADVLWVLLCLANQCNINLSEELQKNLEKKTSRDADRHKANPKLR